MRLLLVCLLALPLAAHADLPRPKAALARPFVEAAKDFNRGHYEDAAKFYRMVRSTYKDTDWDDLAALFLAQCEIRLGHEDEGQAIYLQLIKDHPAAKESIEARFSLAKMAESKGEELEAVGYYEELAALPSDRLAAGQALVDLASLMARRKQYAKASEAYTRVASGFGEFPGLMRQALFGSARVFEAQKQYDKALGNLEAVRHLDAHHPGAGSALMAEGHVYELEGKQDLALQAYRNLESLFPDRAAEAMFFECRILRQTAGKAEFHERVKFLIAQYPGSIWSDAGLHLLNEADSNKDQGGE